MSRTLNMPDGVLYRRELGAAPATKMTVRPTQAMAHVPSGTLWMVCAWTYQLGSVCSSSMLSSSHCGMRVATARSAVAGAGSIHPS
eukprot:2466245-Rhodomonas_salina.1